MILFFWITTALASILVKTLAMKGIDILALPYDPLFYLMCATYAAQTVVWLSILKVMPLSQAYPLTSVNIIFTLVCAYFVFDESISAFNLLGAAVILVGLYIVTTKTESTE